MIFQILDTTRTTITSDLFNLTAHNGGSPYWLPYLKSYLDDIGVETRVASLSELDLSKPWLVSIAPNSWCWPEFEGELLDIFAPDVRNELLNGNGYLVMNHEAESYTTSFFMQMHRVLANSKLNPNKVIYLVGAINPHLEYEKFVEKNNIPKTKRIKIISSVHVFRIFDHRQLNAIQINSDAKKDRKFLSLNRQPKLHRTMMVSLLAHYNLLEHGYVSLGLYPDSMEEYISDLTKIPKYRNLHPEIIDGFEKIRPHLPLKIDDANLQMNQFTVDSLPGMFYEKTYFSVVSSTFALRTQEPCVGFTEKEIKPMLYKQPFMIHGLPGALKQLKRMGFLSFDRWFDESYDEELNDFSRMHKLVLEIKRLSMIPNAQWDIMLEEMKPILLHNYNILVKYNKEHIFFNSDLKDLVHYVS